MSVRTLSLITLHAFAIAIVGCATHTSTQTTGTASVTGDAAASDAPTRGESPARREPVFINANVRILDPELNDTLSFGAPTRVRTGQWLQVETPLENDSDDNVLLEYRFVFLNADSEAIATETPWKKGALLPSEAVSLRGATRAPGAQDFRLEVRTLRPDAMATEDPASSGVPR